MRSASLACSHATPAARGSPTTTNAATPPTACTAHAPAIDGPPSWAVYGGTSWTKLRKVALPSCLPEFFAAVRISVPGAITGALLAEWLAVGGGIGGAVGGYMTGAQFSAVWTAVVLVTGAALILYNIVQILESFVLTRMGMANRI